MVTFRVSRNKADQPMHYLNSYHPLCSEPSGQSTIKRHKLPPFVDGSCRREPDFQSAFPSVTALCRRKKFAPRVFEDDSITYIAVLKKYEPGMPAHWRYVATLKVVRRFESHEEGADWYVKKGLTLPVNCVVEGNPCLPYDMTIGVTSKNSASTDELLADWDAAYKSRKEECGVFLVCQPEFLNLDDPPIVTREDMLRIFGRIPPTQNPTDIKDTEFEELSAMIERHKHNIDSF
jgi:hypothetical protein